MSLRLPASERKEQILDIALKVFASKGYHDAAMNDIAKLAGITKPVVYQHFASKRALYLALVEEVGNRMINSITKATSEVSDGRSQAERGTVAFFRWVSSDTDAFRFLFDSDTRNDREFADAVRRVVDNAAESIAPLITIDLDPAHLQILAQGVVGASEGVARHLSNTGVAFDPNVIGKQVADLLWAGLRGVGNL